VVVSWSVAGWSGVPWAAVAEVAEVPWAAAEVVVVVVEGAVGAAVVGATVGATEVSGAAGTVGATVSGAAAGTVLPTPMVASGACPPALCVVPPQAASADTPRASSAAAVRVVVRDGVVVGVMPPACGNLWASTRVRGGIRPVVQAPPGYTS
jgi:hypothetical protein